MTLWAAQWRNSSLAHLSMCVVLCFVLYVLVFAGPNEFYMRMPKHFVSACLFFPVIEEDAFYTHTHPHRTLSSIIDPLTLYFAFIAVEPPLRCPMNPTPPPPQQEASPQSMLPSIKTFLVSPHGSDHLCILIGICNIITYRFIGGLRLISFRRHTWWSRPTCSTILGAAATTASSRTTHRSGLCTMLAAETEVLYLEPKWIRRNPKVAS